MSDEFQQKYDTKKPQWWLDRIALARRIESLFEEASERMTDWEQRFCEGIVGKFDEAPEPYYTDGQELKMEEILSKY